MVGFGEIIASAVIKELSGKLGSPIWNTIMSQVTFRDDLEAIKSMLSSLQAKLNDAERKSQTDGSVRDLLKKLKAVAYDIEDRLAVYESSSNDGHDGSLRHEWSSFPEKLKSRYNLPREMKKMRRRLEGIKKEMDLTSFKVDGATEEQDSYISRHLEPRRYSSEDTVGRIAEKGRIMDLLLSDEEHSIIPIYGLGGLGKTTLAQMAFSDCTTQIAFEMLAWVYVSEKFDLNAISLSIKQQCNSHMLQYGDSGIHNVAVESILTEKQCLIVLDDLWEENNFKLDELEAMLRLCKKGSKVIVTTRSKKVADRMNKDLQIELGLLPNEDCWTLFRKKARVPTPVPPYVEVMRETIVEKCQGLPLAVKSLGYFLGRMRPTEWEQNLHSNIWAEKDDRFPDNGVIANLKLSYYSMPCSLRLCFAYLSVFPKGSHIQKSSLIQQWIALGFIQPPESIPTEQYAEYCLQELIEMSFLQNVNAATAMSARYTEPQNVLKMHDIVHDLASVIAADEVCIFHASDCSSSNTKNCCRYMYLLNLSEFSRDPILPNTARALHFKDCRKSPKNYSETKFLRILDFSACTINELPDSISHLSLLKYLNVSGLSGTLPKSLSKLHHLQALTLSTNIDLVELPSYICEFLKLQYLDLHGCSKLKKLPDGIHKHKELQHLNLSDCTSLESLPLFSSQSGGLQKLSFLNVSHCSQLVKLSFLEEKLEKQPDHYLPNMVHLNMSFCPKLQELPTGLFKHMRKLLFLNFSGCTSLEDLPEFVEHDAGCSMLEVLDLSGCAKLPALPESSTELRELRCLNLSGCSKLQNFLKLIPRWKFGTLEYLNISGVGAKSDSEAPGTSAEDQSSQDPIKELELGMLQEDIITQGLFRLKYLSIGGFTLYSEQGIARMVDLLTLPNFNVRLQDDGRCSNILILQQILDVTHRQLNIKCLENVVFSEEVKQLELDRMRQFHSLGFEWSLSGMVSFVKQRAVLGNLRPHRNLQSLSIKSYICTEFPDWINKINDTLPDLVKLVFSDINGCNYIPISQLPNLKELEINNMPRLNKIYGTLPNLVKLILSHIERCDHIPVLGNLPNLQELEIYNMPQLHDARIGPCNKLRRLTLVGLPNEATMVESSHGCDEEMTETGQEFNTLPGCSFRKNEVRRSEELSRGPSTEKGKVTSAALPELDYLQIGSCHDLKLHPTPPKSKEYFVKDSSLSLPVDKEDTSSFPSRPYDQYTEGCSHSGQGTAIPPHEHAMQKSIPRLKSKLHIEGSRDQLRQWTELLSTHLDELTITDPLFYNSKYLEEESTVSEHDSLESIYGLPESCIANLEKINLPPSHQYGLEECSNYDNIVDFVGRIDSQVPYINIGKVGTFSVKPIEEGGIFCSSNIPLLYKHYDGQSSSLVIKNLENLKGSLGEVQELAKYQQVRLVWSRSNFIEDSSMAEDKAVLQKLRPHHDLETIEIEGYRGDEFCYWMMNINSSLPNLVTVKLSNIANCQCLPPLGQLANLEVLHISDMPSVRKVDGHVYGTEKPFRKLRELELSTMKNLEEWSTTTLLLTGHNDHQLSRSEEVFPNLQVLLIANCPRMRFVPAFPRSRECTLEKSYSILLSFEQFIGSSNLALIALKINDSGSSSDIVKFLQGCVNLLYLTIDSCIDLITLPEPIKNCHCLRKLEITNCWNFSVLPEWLGELTFLQKLDIQASKLEYLPQSIQRLTALERLVLNKCNYKLRERCTSGEDKEKIKHIKTIDMNEVPLMYLTPSYIMLLQQVTSSQFIDLHIGGLECMIGLREMENLELQTKKELSSLSLEWSYAYADSSDKYASSERGMQNRAVFEKLQPHDSLEILCIKNYAGVDFPRWMSLLPNLVQLKIVGMQFEYLHLDQFQNLKELFLSRVQFAHLHLNGLQNLIELSLSGLKFGHLHIDQLQNLRELKVSGVEFQHLHLERLQNITELKLSEERFERLHIDQLQNLKELKFSSVEFGHLHLERLQSITKLELCKKQFEHLHLVQLENLRQLYLFTVKFECVVLHQLQNLEELHLSQIESQKSNKPVCIECSQPLRKLQKIVMTKIINKGLQISVQGGEGDKNLFPGLQHLEMELCENLRFQPSIPRSTHYIISGEIYFDKFNYRRILGSFLFPSFKQVMGTSIPGSTSRMEIKNTSGLSSERWKSIPHLELLNITELTIDKCVDSCPVPKCILGWKSLQKLEIRRCEDIELLPEWLGEMSCLTELIVETYWMEALHPCIRRLTNLQSLTLITCLNRFKERCKSGDDWINIKHIPHIQITDRNGRTEIISPSFADQGS
uniref:NB-ARC domain-containing protein n=2 Tax=Oryza nivara TaxID=4536 RepID=A0A0E0HU28_ORYNI